MIELQSRDLGYSLTERENYFESHKKLSMNCVLLHTCNRVEVYSGSGSVPSDIARHLFRVACGLESAMLGETAIQGQLKNAYEKARKTYDLSSGLHRLFQHAIRAGKRVRSETDISSGAMSHSKAVIEILRQDGVDLSKARILIIGVSNINSSVLSYLVEKGGRTIFVANRTYAKALELSRIHGCSAVKFDALPCILNDSDIIISATSAPHLIIKKGQLKISRPVIIFDLAVPRDIDPSLSESLQITLYNVEDIEKRICNNRGKRIQESEKAEKIIDEEMVYFYETPQVSNLVSIS